MDNDKAISLAYIFIKKHLIIFLNIFFTLGTKRMVDCTVSVYAPVPLINTVISPTFIQPRVSHRSPLGTPDGAYCCSSQHPTHLEQRSSMMGPWFRCGGGWKQKSALHYCGYLKIETKTEMTNVSISLMVYKFERQNCGLFGGDWGGGS